MVSMNFFKNEMAKVFEQFGANKFSTRKVDLIYNAIKYLEEDQLVSVVDSIIGNSKYTPTVDDFRDKARAYNVNTFIKSDCNTCGGNGMFSANYKKTGQAFAFSCTCKNGRLYPAFTNWSTVNQNDFTRIAPRAIDYKGKTNCYEGVKKDFDEFTNKFFRGI